MTPEAPLNRLIIYTKRLDEMVQFYADHFGYSADDDPNDRITELTPAHGGAVLMLHPMSDSRKDGQVLVKLTFDVEDVAGFCERAKEKGLVFGSIHKADGYIFANAKDPSGNSISISSRAFRK
jgi:predicted enzyme related to lactoylglutathione lyase